MYQIVTVNYLINSPDVLRAAVDDTLTWLDADILVINPSCPSSQGTDGLIKLTEMFSRRKQEVITLLKTGKVVIVFTRPIERRGPSGGPIVSNYDWLPTPFYKLLADRIIPGQGSEIIPVDHSHPFAPYFRAFQDGLCYYAYLSAFVDSSHLFIANKPGNPVGWSFKLDDGLLVFVPPPPSGVDPSKLIGVLIQCAKPILTKDFRTPEPEWARGYTIPGEGELQERLERIQSEIVALEATKSQLESDKESLSGYRALLYEQGKPLEDVVLKSLGLLGFEAKPYKKDDLVHDAVLEAPEGRAVAEIEGKDKDAIHIDKIDQLSRVVDEDFRRHDNFSKGLLIGNPYRLLPLDEREDPFTEKARTAAEHKGFGLLTTAELFTAVVKVLEDPDNEDLKTACRKAILEAQGGQIRFPVD